jgi:uncharacterized protein
MKERPECPRCDSDLREMSKDGVLIDVCSRCGGVWLDRGELEKIIRLANQDIEEYAAYRPEQPPATPPTYNPPRSSPGYNPPTDSGGYYNDAPNASPAYHNARSHPYHKKRSRLEGLFDLFD